MAFLPDYIGAAAFGIKLGVIYPGCDLMGLVTEALEKCSRDRLLEDGDIVCITESILARAQDNYVTVEEVAKEVQKRLHVSETSRVGVVFPILSRNRFSLILQGIAAAVPRGEVIVQLSYPTDEVGNELVPAELAALWEREGCRVITQADLGGQVFLHPITKVNYLKLYRESIEAVGAKATLVLCNDPKHITTFKPDGVIAADIHSRNKTQQAILAEYNNCINLTKLCCTGKKRSEWGLLGSNMSSGKKLKLAPRESGEFACLVRDVVKEKVGIAVEVIIYGDGAYKDPSTGIYELADPMPVFGSTPGVTGRFREGVKYKYIADTAIAEGKTPAEIECILADMKKESHGQGHVETEGTTPRRMEDLIASLADLISGSADAGTPVVLVKGF